MHNPGPLSFWGATEQALRKSPYQVRTIGFLVRETGSDFFDQRWEFVH